MWDMWHAEDMGNGYKILVAKPEEKSIWETRCRWEDKINLNRNRLLGCGLVCIISG
jgi:hypothetical protein